MCHVSCVFDRIENNVSDAKEYALEGFEQTKQAVEYHKSLVKVNF